MRRNKKGKTVPQDLFVFLVLGLLFVKMLYELLF